MDHVNLSFQGPTVDSVEEVLTVGVMLFDEGVP